MYTFGTYNCNKTTNIFENIFTFWTCIANLKNGHSGRDINGKRSGYGSPKKKKNIEVDKKF